MTTIGDRIRRERIKQGVLQERLSRGICSQSSLSRLENNSMGLSLMKVNQILGRLGLSFNDLLATEESIREKIFMNELDSARNQDDYERIERVLAAHDEMKESSGERARMYIKWHAGLLALHKKGYQNAESQLRRAIYMADKYKFRDCIPELYTAMGATKYSLGEQPLKYYTRAYKSYKDLNIADFRIETKILYHLIICHSNAGQHHQVIMKCRKAVKILSRNYSTYMMCEIYNAWLRALASLNKKEDYIDLRGRIHIIFENHSCLEMWEKLENYPVVNN